MNLFHFLCKIKKTLTGNLVIKGTLILTIAGFITRIIGFYNRIFLSGLISAKEMGIYQLIFPLYMVAFAITTCGNELALTKLVSEYYGRKDKTNAKSFFHICFLFNLFLGIFIAFVMHQNAKYLCLHVLNAPECDKCLKILCLGVPFMAMKGSIHGYFLGMKRSEVHGISDLLEQTAKVYGLYVLSSYICIRNSYDAAFAVWGIVIGEIVAFLYSVLALLFHNYKNQKPESTIPKKQCISLPKSILIKRFLSNSIPLTTNRLALTVLQSMEAIMIPTVLLLYFKDSEKSLATYGVFSGMAFPFIMFPSTITNSLSTMLLPAVSNANSSLQKDYLKKLCEKSIHFCLIIGMFSTITFYIFGSDIGITFFQNKEAGIFLYQLSFLCPLIYLATTLASMLNGFGLATYNLILTVVATIIRISFIYFLIPRIGMVGYIAGLFAGYLFQNLGSIIKIEKILPIEIHFMESIFLPGCLFTLLGVLMYYLYTHLPCILSLASISPVIPLLVIIFLFSMTGVVPFIIRASID